jgi:hypothetical protein
MLMVLADLYLNGSTLTVIFVVLTRPGQGENPFIFALKLNAPISGHAENNQSWKIKVKFTHNTTFATSTYHTKSPILNTSAMVFRELNCDATDKTKENCGNSVLSCP